MLRLALRQRGGAPLRRALLAPLARALAAAAPPPGAPAPPPPASSMFSMSGMLAKVREMGPAALGVYFAFWAAPIALSYGVVVSGVVDAPDPLIFVDTHLPAFFGDGVRYAGSAFGIELKPGVPLSKQTSGLMYGLILTDLIEPLRILATLYVTPRLLARFKRAAP
jgi:hypothetical protein